MAQTSSYATDYSYVKKKCKNKDFLTFLSVFG